MKDVKLRPGDYLVVQYELGSMQSMTEMIRSKLSKEFTPRGIGVLFIPKGLELSAIHMERSKVTLLEGTEYTCDKCGKKMPPTKTYKQNVGEGMFAYCCESCFNKKYRMIRTATMKEAEKIEKEKGK